eukprot:scaffold14974_cov195-Amphora_coffeaeformis.AAC.32
MNYDQETLDLEVEEDERGLRGGFRFPPLRALVHYGGLDNLMGFMPLYDGTILGMTVVLDKAITSGQLGFSFQVNEEDYVDATLVFSSSNGRSQMLELDSPVPVAAGDLIKIHVRESRFQGDFDTTQNVFPGGNTAGFVLMMQH